MINATKEKLASFFQGTIQYQVPFFQRAYVWDDENWATLWDHILAVLERHEQGLSGEHFIGTVITKQRPAERLGQQVHDLIDGQQRLTTIALLLQAISDTATGDVPRLKEAISNDLRFRDTRNEVHSRIIPSSYDRIYFDTIMAGKPDGQSLNDGEHKIARAHLFFRERLSDMDDDRRDHLRLVLLERVSLISMMLSHEDDEQEIFDTINALGVRLTTAELLKNYIFKEPSIQSHYNSLWKEVYEDSEEEVEFWNAERTAGRIIRTNVEILLYCYLVIKTGAEVKLESLFKEYKKWLEGQDGSSRLAFLRELKQYAELFWSFPSGADLNEIKFDEWEKRFFHIVENLMITTVLPLVLYVYKSVPHAAMRRPILGIVESYLVRRNVCRLTTKNYNLLFVQAINRLKETGDAVDAGAIARILAPFGEDTNRFPSNEEFAAAIHSEALSNQNSREILFLLALRQVSDGFSDVATLSLGNYTVEHMMPVKWEANWTDREMTSDQKAQRSRKLKTLGNLTLVTKRLNSRMQNAAWSEKKRHLRQYSSLPLTIPYIDGEPWDEGSIDRRARDLIEVATSIWSTLDAPQTR
jgi:uncharacterized protein with ParB-like and HNH nuclease domain